MARLRDRPWRWPHLVIANAALAAVYFGAAKAGLTLAFRSSSVTAIWPPTGIALVAVFVAGYRMLPGVLLGALLANATTGHVPAGYVLLIALGNTAEALLGVRLLRYFAFDPALERLRDVIALAILAGAVSTAIAATVGTTSLLAASNIHGHDYGPVWRTWWLGDMGGDLLIAPALFVALFSSRKRELPGGWLEAFALVSSLVVLSIVVFSVSVPLPYVVIPGLVWAALRFWQPGAAVSSLIVAGIAVGLTAGDHGPFVRGDEDASLLLAQTFVGFAGLTAYVLAAASTERRRVEEAIERIADSLQASLLPGQLPEIPNVEAAAHFRPAGIKSQVGGDFYDVFEVGPRSFGVVVGDVCGKGPHAAGVTGLARHTVRTASRYESAPSRLLTLLNDAIRLELAPEDFCTASCSRLELDEDGAALTVANAGHPLPLVLRADGHVETAGRPGTLLGVVERPQLEDHTVRLAPGDAFVVYTDGLTEAFAPRRVVETEEVAAELAKLAGRSAGEIVEALTRTMLANGGLEPRDDVAVLVLRVLPTRSAGPVPAP